MKQLKSYVVSNRQVLPAFERPSTSSFDRAQDRSGQVPRGRNILGSYIIRLHCPEIAAEAKPGHFIMVRCPDEVGILPRPFSVHRVVNEDIELFFATLDGGKGTRWLSRRQENEEVELFGPLGNGFTIDPGAKNLLLVAGGIGVAPLVFLAQEALRSTHSVTLLLGAVSASQLYPLSFLPPKIKLATATEDGSAGRKGRVTSLIPDHIDRADQIFACGPVPMYKDMHQQSESLLMGKPTQISMETIMGCGRGVCYGCGVKTGQGIKEVCTAGPVFDLDDVLWDQVDA